MTKILIVDDQVSIQSTMADILESQNYQVECASSGKECLEKAKVTRYHLIFLDVKMQGMNGWEVLSTLVKNYPDTAVIMMSGHGNIASATDAIHQGAFTFLAKPIDLKRLLNVVSYALDKKHPFNIRRTATIPAHINTGKGNHHKQMIGNCPKMQKLKKTITRAGRGKARVLITGPNGAGKEMVARALYEASPRKDGPYIEVNCAAIPNELIESVLFGHKKGAFTGAMRDSKGMFEQANGGTLFMDEIGDMSLTAQAKVLRALEEQKVTRVGDDRDIKVDVRIIAATNKNLLEMIAHKQFRDDLYYRLNVISITVPSLNERRSDIPLLVDHFNSFFSMENNVEKRIFEPEAMTVLQQINYRGNIRQLRNIIESLIVMGDKIITQADVNEIAPSALDNQALMIEANNYVCKFKSPKEAIDFIRNNFGS